MPCHSRRKERTPHMTAPSPTHANIDDAFHINLLPNENQLLSALPVSLQHCPALSSDATLSSLPSDFCLSNKSFPMKYVMSELTKATVA